MYKPKRKTNQKRPSTIAAAEASLWAKTHECSSIPTKAETAASTSRSERGRTADHSGVNLSKAEVRIRKISGSTRVRARGMSASCHRRTSVGGRAATAEKFGFRAIWQSRPFSKQLGTYTP